MTPVQPNRIKIAHIINPVRVEETSDLYIAQPITFETMRAARDFAQKEVAIELYAAFFPEDEVIVPDYIEKTEPLKRSIQDILSPGTRKKLPLIKDILNRLYDVSVADYFIYTNVDIALMPEFYFRIKGLIQKGHDGFVINRRTIWGHFSGTEDIARMYTQAKSGKPHPGFDCFVFKRSAYPRYYLGTACLGANGVGRVVLSNVMAFSARFRVFRDLHLTFHIGDRKDWEKREFDAFERHNTKELAEVLRILLKQEGVSNRRKLKVLQRQLLKSTAQRCAPRNIISLNSPEYRLPDKPENIYPPAPVPGFSIRQDPIFIVGYPRSGTTLVQALVATQGDIVSFPETHFFCLVWRRIKEKNGWIPRSFVPEAIAIIRKKIPFSTNAEAHVKTRTSEAGLLAKALFETAVVDNLIGRVPPEQLNTVRWMEKTPHHVFYLDTILGFYPRAKIIYVMRNPEKSILSRRENLLFNDEDLWPVRKHARQWLRGVLGMEKVKAEHPDSLVVVRIEDMAQSPTLEMQRVCDFLNIPFDRQRLGRYKDKARSFYHSWELWKNGASLAISAATALREKDHLPPAEQHELLRVAGQKIADYGYALTPSAFPHKDLVLLRLKEPLLNLNILARKARRALPFLLTRKLNRSLELLKLKQGI